MSVAKIRKGVAADYCTTTVRSIASRKCKTCGTKQKFQSQVQKITRHCHSNRHGMSLVPHSM